MADLNTAAKDALDYLTALHKLGDIDGQVGGEIMSQLTEALEAAQTSEFECGGEAMADPNEGWMKLVTALRERAAKGWHTEGDLLRQAANVIVRQRQALHPFARDRGEEVVKREGRRALVHAVASLAAAISLLERTPNAKKAAPSDRMFDQMLKDYRKALEEARAVLNNPGAETARQFSVDTWGADWVANEWVSLLEFVSRATGKENLPQVRHLKRQSTYDVLGEGTVQISVGQACAAFDGSEVEHGRLLAEGDKMTVYRAHEDGELYLRFPDEFNDGRFEKLD